jgi:hypothetical protein
MNDARRYRMNATESLSAADRCGPAYRDLTFALAESWLSLGRQQEAMDELLAIWSKAHSATLAAPSRQVFSRPIFTGPHSPVPLAVGIPSFFTTSTGAEQL